MARACTLSAPYFYTIHYNNKLLYDQTDSNWLGLISAEKNHHSDDR